MKLVKSIDEYRTTAKTNCGDIPVIQNKNITEIKCKEYEKYHIRNAERIPVDYIIFISKGIDFLQFSIEKVYRGYESYYISDYGSKPLNGKITVIGLYRDFTTVIDRKINLLCEESASLVYIIGEDMAALSYQIMKQGYKTSFDKSLVVFGNLLSASEMKFAMKLEQNGIRVITQQDFRNDDISEIIQERYKTILFFGHGKDDHINVGEYTICGKHFGNCNCCAGPVCHYTGKCFKSDDKLINASDLKAENLILASCHSGVFYDAANYSSPYNLMLSAIYSEARTITFAVSGSRFDYQEISSLLFENYTKNPAEIINGSLRDIMSVPVFRSIGNLSEHPFSRRNEYNCPVYNKSNINAILETCREFIEFDFLPENEEFVHKVFKFYRDGIKTFNRTQICLPDIGNKEKVFYQRIYELDKELAEYISKNYYAVCDMSSYALNNMSVDRNCPPKYLIAEDSTIYHFENDGIQYNNIKETFSYKVVDECFSFGDCNVTVKEFIYDKTSRKIHFCGSVAVMNNTNCFYGIGFPGYMRNYLSDANPFHEIESDINGNYSVEISVLLKEDSPRQAHYCGFYLVQNMKIYHHKLVFNI